MSEAPPQKPAPTSRKRYDVFVHTNLSPWDLAPGILLVQEIFGVGAAH